MFKRQSPAVRDDELLSAYIDNRLSASERARLDARLVAEPALRAELDGLRQVVQAVRAIPRKPAPRSFALDPRRYAPRQTFLTRIYPTLRIANAAVALVFVVVLGALVLQAVPRMGFGATAAMPQAPGALELAATAAPAQAPLPEVTTAAAEPASAPAGTDMAGDATSKVAATATPAPAAPAGQTPVPPQAAETPPPGTDGGTRGDETPMGQVLTTSITETVPGPYPAPQTPAPLEPTLVPPDETPLASRDTAVGTASANDAYAATPAQGEEARTGGQQAPPAVTLDLGSLAIVLAVVFGLLMVLTVAARRQMRR